MKILFYVPKNLDQGVTNSQIINLVKILEKMFGYHISIFSNGNQLIEVSNTVIKKHYYLLKHFNQFDYIYVRHLKGYAYAHILRLLLSKKVKILFDFRGFNTFERFIAFDSPPKLKFFLALKVEQFAYNNAYQVNAVSHSFKKILTDFFGVRKKNLKQINVVPCCIDTVFLKQGRTNNNINFVYSGSLLPWQKFAETIDLYKSIASFYNNVTLTILTRDVESARKIIADNNLPNVNILNLSQKEVLNKLPQFDFGFLLREDNYVNKVASPIKFIEYISRGVIPILSPNIGDYSDLVSLYNIGIVLDKNYKFDLQQINNLLTNDKIYQQLYNIALEYKWENYFEKHSFIVS